MKLKEFGPRGASKILLCRSATATNIKGKRVSFNILKITLFYNSVQTQRTILLLKMFAVFFTYNLVFKMLTSLIHLDVTDFKVTGRIYLRNDLYLHGSRTGNVTHIFTGGPGVSSIVYGNPATLLVSSYKVERFG